jgi:hypothetical protein
VALASRQELKYLADMERFVAVVASVAMLLGLAETAQAQDASRAEEAFQRGRSLLAEKRYPEACKSFEESQKEDPASGSLLALAYCQELSGQLASAWTNYHAAAELAQREGHRERQTAATDQSRALKDRVSVLTILVPPALAGVQGLQVKLDGVDIAPAAFGTPIPVNGGTYRVEAAVGNVTWSATVAVQGERDKKTLVIELLAPSSGAQPAVPAGQPSPKQPTSRVPTDDQGTSRVLEHVGLATAIGGLATLGVGFGFGLVAISKNNASKRDGHCDASGCDTKGVELQNDALDAAHVSTWCVVAGSALTLGGGALYFGAKASSNRSSTRITTRVTQGGAQVLVTETF